jgi:hypothetical protein
MAGTGTRTVQLTLTLTVSNPQNVEEGKRVIQITDVQDYAAQSFPQEIPAGTVDYALNMQGVIAAKWILLEIDHEVTLKLNQNAPDLGFPVKGVFLLQSESGITSVFVTTGVNPTCVKFLAVGS